MEYKVDVADVCIIGSGPAAHTASIYTTRARLNTVMFEGWMANGIFAGGHLTATTEVENFPGFPDGIRGDELCNLFRKQSCHNGTKIYTETVTRVDLSVRPFKVYVGEGYNEQYIETKTIIVATGATARKLTFLGSNEFWNKGISTCAVCDGAKPIFHNKQLAVIGGGDSAMEAAMYLTKHASKVYLIHRHDRLTACKVMQERVFKNPKIRILWNTEVIQAIGGSFLENIRIKNNMLGIVDLLSVKGLFYAIGYEPASKFLNGQLETDIEGYIITKPDSTLTSVNGVFAAGNVKDKKYRQAITSAGSGCMAGLDTIKYLECST
jgi:thioredoxin reductase (NADPH)